MGKRAGSGSGLTLIGSHPTAGAGASPHAWGEADADLVLLDSLIAERGDGSLIIGRGVPNPWVSHSNRIALANVPITGGHRMGLKNDVVEWAAITFRGGHCWSGRTRRCEWAASVPAEIAADS